MARITSGLRRNALSLRTKWPSPPPACPPPSSPQWRLGLVGCAVLGLSLGGQFGLSRWLVRPPRSPAPY